MEGNRQKEIIVAVGISFATVLVFVAIGLATNDAQAFGSPFGIFTAVMAIVWTALVACAYAFFYEWRAGRYALTSIAMLSAVWAGLFSGSAIVGALVLGAFLGSASQMISSSVRERLVFRLRPTILPGLRIILAGVAVTVIALLLPLVREQISRGKIFVPTDSVELALRPAAPLLGNVIEGYTADSTVNQLIDMQLQKQLAELPPETQFPANQQDQVRQELSRTIGIQLTGNETVPDILTAYGNKYVQGLADQNGITVTIILLAIGLLAIRALVPLLAWAALIVAAILFFIARHSKLVTIQQIQMPVDRLRL